MQFVPHKIIPRREFLATSAAAIGAGLVAWPCSAAAKPANYKKLRTEDFLGPVEIVTEISDTKVFTEGPAVDRAGRVFFTNTEAEKILMWDPATKKLSVFRENSGAANGLFFDPQGRLLACEGGAKRVTRTDMKTGKIEVLAAEYNGFPLAAPNDLCLDAQGRVYFTSRPGVSDPTQGNVNAVYRITPADDGQHQIEQMLRWPDVHMPNGIVINQRQDTLYLVESHPDADHNRQIKTYRIDNVGRVVGGQVLIDFSPGRSGDGMCIDVNDYLYVAAGLHKTRNTSETLDTRPGIHVINQHGDIVAFRETPVDTITNCTFGGADLKTLYVTCGKYLLSIRTTFPGKPSYRPHA